MQNGSKTPQVSISYHITPFQVFSNILWKIEFLVKMAILMIFGFSPYAGIWPIFWLDVSKNVIYGRKWPLETLKPIVHTLDDNF